MPTDDVQIQVVGAAPIPLSYTIPGNGQLQPKAVSAVFDGTGASGNFLPTLEIISDGGIVVARCPAPVVVAGASAEVSWFPHVAQTTAAAGALNPDWATYYMDVVTVSSGGRGSANIHQSLGSALLTGLPSAPVYAQTGVYAISAWVQSSAAWTAGAIAGGRLYTNTALTNFFVNSTAAATPAGVLEPFNVTLTSQFQAGDSFDFEAENFDTANRDMYSNEILVQLIGTF